MSYRNSDQGRPQLRQPANTEEAGGKAPAGSTLPILHVPVDFDDCIDRDHAAHPTPKGSQWIGRNHTHARDSTGHGSKNKVAAEIQKGRLYMTSRLERLQSLRSGIRARNQLVSVVQSKPAMRTDHDNANRHRQKICRAHRHRWDECSSQCSADVQEPWNENVHLLPPNLRKSSSSPLLTARILRRTRGRWR